MLDAYIAPNATVVGDVTLHKNANIWYNAVLRGDSGAIVIGEGTNVQDHCVIHEKTTIGNNCTIGHSAIVHGCTIGDGCVIGMGAIVLTGAVLGDGCLVGAGALVTGKTVAPAGSMLLGSPAKIVGTITKEQWDALEEDAEKYLKNAQKWL